MHKAVLNFLYHLKHPKLNPNRGHCWNVLLYHSLKETHEELYSTEWYERAFPKLTKLAHALKNVDWIDGRLVKIEDESTVMDDDLECKMHVFKSVSRAFLGSPSVQKALDKKALTSLAGSRSIPSTCFSRPIERQPITLNSLTRVCNFLNVSAQQRKLVRLTICPQVTHHHVWVAALEEILKSLKYEVESLNYQSIKGDRQMGQQILSSCLQFLADTSVSFDPDSTSWMRLTPSKKVALPASRRWGDVLEMINDLIKCLRNMKGPFYSMTKLEIMKEGLYQVKDVIVDRDIGYKEACHQESLVQKKLAKTLGHSSQCLFTLLLYYLCGSVRDVEVEVCGGIYRVRGKDCFCLCIGKVLTSDDDKMVWSAMRQLDRALGVFRFVWETAKMNRDLTFQGHLWCPGGEDRTFTYRGNKFFLHGICP